MSFTDEYQHRDEYAAERKVSPRTVDRWRKLPDGLPYLSLGGKVWIPRAEGREWERSRIRRPNPRGAR